MIRRLLLSSFILNLVSHGLGQSCEFNAQYKKGSTYYFATYLGKDNLPLNGECNLDMSNTGKPYQRRVFKNGIIQQEIAYFANSDQVQFSYTRIDKDTLLAEYFLYQESGIIHEHGIYFKHKPYKRCLIKKEYNALGKIHRIEQLSEVSVQELKNNGDQDPFPEHIIDAEGFAGNWVPYGDSKLYYDNGQLMYVYRHERLAQRSLYMSPNESLHGEFSTYFENGTLRQIGQYKHGRKTGKWLTYDYNGKVIEVQTFVDDFEKGTSMGYHSNGTVSYTKEFNDSLYVWPLPHEKTFYETGTLQSEFLLLQSGPGFKHEYYPNGQLKYDYKYAYTQQNCIEKREWYENGQLKFKYYAYPKNDTVNVSYFANGQIESLYLRGIHMDSHYHWHENGQLHKKTVNTTLLDQSNLQSFTYYPDGICAHKLIVIQDSSDECYFYSDGSIKKHLQRKNTLLEGEWLEQDSLHHITHSGFYHNGLLITAPPDPKFTSTQSTQEANKWAYAALKEQLKKEVQLPTFSVNGKPEITSIEWEEFQSRIAQLYMELPTMWTGFEFNVKDNDEHIYCIRLFEPGLFAYREKIDSALRHNHISNSRLVWDQENQATHLFFTTQSMFTIPYLKSLITPWDLSNQVYWSLQPEVVQVDYFKRLYQANGLQFQLLENDCWLYKITIENQQLQVTQYPNGYVELYNAQGSWKWSPTPIEHIHPIGWD